MHPRLPTLPSLRLPSLHGLWGPLAIAASLWLVLLLFGAELIAPQAVKVSGASLPLTDLGPWRTGGVLALVGFLAGAALPLALSPFARGMVVLAMTAVWGAILAGYQLAYALPQTPIVLGIGILGLVLGVAAGGVALPAARGRAPWLGGSLAATLGPLAVAAALVSSLLPLSPTNPLTEPFTSAGLGDLATGTPQRVYALIKVAMLWVPLGFVFAAGGLSAGLRRWTAAGVGGFVVVGWAFADGLRISDLLEVLGAPVGVWVGLWLGEHTATAVHNNDSTPEPAHLVHETPAPSAPQAGQPPQRPPAVAQTPPSPGTPAASIGTPSGRPMPTPPPAPERPAAPSAAKGPGEPGETSPAGLALPRPLPRALLPALALLALAAWGWWDFPRFQLPLGLALLLYTVLLAVSRHAWLVAVPAVLPALDLAPWTGRFFLDETDLFLLVTLGAAFLHRPSPEADRYLARPVAALGVFFVVTTLVALLVGLFPLSPPDANAFASYFSHFNAVRVGKGFAWGLAFFLLLRWTAPKGSPLPARLFTRGMLLGLAGVILIGVRERWQFADLLDFSEPYRITASFSSMHTGGSHLPAFLALAVPFVWLWVVRLKSPLALLSGLVLFAGALYLMVSTVTRAGVLALGVDLVLLGIFWLRALHGRTGHLAASALSFALMAGLAVGIVFLGTQGAYFQKRMATVEADADTRLNHWRSTVWMMDQDALTRLFGMGLGTFPETYLLRNPLGRVPGSYRYLSEGDNGYLALGSGETLYLAQRVTVESGVEYRLAFDVKGTKDTPRQAPYDTRIEKDDSAGGVPVLRASPSPPHQGQGREGAPAATLKITIPLCEKHLLDSRACVWRAYSVPGTGEWEHRSVTLKSGSIGTGNWLSRPPVELFLYNGEKDQSVAVDNLSLRAPDGTELLKNGDFSAGGDFWFFKTHDHLAWHIKNLWVSLLFEQGWVGLIAFNLFLLAALLHLLGPAWRGNATAAAALTAVVGFLTVGLFASPFDAPRLTALFFAALAVGLHGSPAGDVTRSKQRPRLHRYLGSRRKPRPQEAAQKGA